MFKTRHPIIAGFCGAWVFLAHLTTPAAAADSGTNLAPVAQGFGKYISAYEPIYFILGTYPAAEFQFSLKYQVSAMTNGWAQATTNLFLAYTQTSYWDLLSSDPSFYDTSYKPSIFYRLQNVFNSTNAEDAKLDLQAGFEHESNGRGGAQERSMYRTYLAPTLTLARSGGWELNIRPRAWFYAVDFSQNNPDMPNYKGYADLQTTLSWLRPGADPSQAYKLATYFDLGDQGSHAAWKFDLSFSVAQWVDWFTPRIHVQYFTGYGQTLRQYNQYAHGLRAGISLYD